MIDLGAGSRRLAFVAIATGMLGCGNLVDEFHGPEAAALPPALLNMPMPPGYPSKLAAVQSIRAVHAEQSYDFEAFLQVGSAQVAIVLALPFGPRLASIDWSAAGIETRRDIDLPLAELLRPENVLADIVLAFWPEAAVRASLAPGVTLVVEAGTRHFGYRDRPAVSVHYGGGDPWGQETTVVNHLLGYRLVIASRRLPDA